MLVEAKDRSGCMVFSWVESFGQTLWDLGERILKNLEAKVVQD